MSSIALVAGLLAQKRLAVVGVLRKPEDFSRKLFGELRERGYEVVPVNPLADEIDGRRCFAHLQEDPAAGGWGAVDDLARSVPRELCRSVSTLAFPRVWMYRRRHGSGEPKALQFCQAHNIA